MIPGVPWTYFRAGLCYDFHKDQQGSRGADHKTIYIKESARPGFPYEDPIIQKASSSRPIWNDRQGDGVMSPVAVFSPKRMSRPVAIMNCLTD